MNSSRSPPRKSALAGKHRQPDVCKTLRKRVPTGQHLAGPPHPPQDSTEQVPHPPQDSTEQILQMTAHNKHLEKSFASQTASRMLPLDHAPLSLCASPVMREPTCTAWPSCPPGSCPTKQPGSCPCHPPPHTPAQLGRHVPQCCPYCPYHACAHLRSLAVTCFLCESGALRSMFLRGCRDEAEGTR